MAVCSRSTRSFPTYEFSERHELEIAATREQVDRALSEVSVDEIRGIRVLYLLRGLGRGRHDTKRPFLGLTGIGAVELENEPGVGVVLGLTGQFWRLRGGVRDPARPRTAQEFLATTARTCARR